MTASASAGLTAGGRRSPKVPRARCVRPSVPLVMSCTVACTAPNTPPGSPAPAAQLRTRNHASVRSSPALLPSPAVWKFSRCASARTTSRPLYPRVRPSQPLGSPIRTTSGLSTFRMCRAPRLLGASSSVAPITTKRAAASASGGRVATAAMNAHSGPLASTLPRPCSTPWSSTRTGISPGTVSMCPSSATVSGPRPRSPTAFPASSTRAVKPRAAIQPVRNSATGPSCPDSDAVCTARISSSRAS